MAFVETHIKWLMLVAGALTCTMVYAVIAPVAALEATFGETLEGPLAELVVRNWGVLITLVGGMLIYGAFNPVVRPLVLTVAVVSKLTFIALVLVHGARYVGIAIALDAIWIVLFAYYLVRVRASAANGVEGEAEHPKFDKRG